MSKNFYGIIKSEIIDWENRKQEALNEAVKLKGLIPIIEEHYENRKPKQIHLGQNSSGWKFLFQWNDGKYYTNKLEFLNFIETLDIVDEYGTPYTAGEFWNYIQNTDWNNKKAKSRTINQYSKDYFKDYIIIDDMEFLNCEFS